MSGFARGKVLAAGVALSLLVGPSPAEGLNMCAKEPLQADGIVRLSRIEVYPEHLDTYIQLAREVGEVSLRTEPTECPDHVRPRREGESLPCDDS